MHRRVQCVAILIVGMVLVGHAFLYDGLFTAVGLVSFLDPVGAISLMPYGTYHVGIGVVYATTAVMALWGAERSPSLRGLLLVVGGGLLAACSCSIAYWIYSSTPLGWWGGSYILATAQVMLFPLLGISGRANNTEGAPPVILDVSLRQLFWFGSLLLFAPLLVYGLAGVAAGGWGVLNAATVVVLGVLNASFGYPLYRLGRGVSVAGWRYDKPYTDHPSRS